MGIRHQNIDEYLIQARSAAIEDGTQFDIILHANDEPLSPFVPFNCEIAAVILTVTTAVTAATSVACKITDGTNDLTNVVTIEAADAAGTSRCASGNGTQVAAGTALTLDLTETGTVTAGEAECWLVLRKTQPGPVWSRTPAT
jgi:hypothetical protein